MREKLTHIAVLTGDIIGSTQMSPEDLERAFDALSDCAEAMKRLHGEDLLFTRQRGDGWQVRLARPELALRTALAFRAALRREGKEFSTLMAVAVGKVSPNVPSKDLNEYFEEAYIQSGRVLDAMKPSSLQCEMMYVGDDGIGAAFSLADHISQAWTPTQASAILPILTNLDPPTYTSIAKAQGKSRQAIKKSLEGAGSEAFEIAFEMLEQKEAQDV